LVVVGEEMSVTHWGEIEIETRGGVVVEEGRTGGGEG
jgi:hypothetical protein